MFPIKKKKIYAVIFLASSLVIFFAFGFYRLSKFETTDEHYWIQERIPQYWEAVSERKWKQTLINDKPGISLAYVSGFAMFFEKNVELYTNPEKHVSVYNPAATERLNFVFRVPILIFNGLFSIFFFWIIRRISKNDWLALWFSSFILLSPILLGISRIINPDTLLWVFSTAVIFSFIAFLESKEKKFIIFTSLFLGCALLSKYIATVLFPFLFILLILDLIRNYEKWNEEKQLKINFLKLSSYYWAVVLASFAFFAFLFPAVILDKDYYQQKTIITILFELKLIFLFLILVNAFILTAVNFLKKEYIISIYKRLAKLRDISAKLVYLVLALIFILILANWTLGHDFMNLSRIPFDARKDLVFSQGLPLNQKILLEFYPLVYSLSPLVIISLLFLWIRSLFRKNSFDWITFPASLFLLAYIAASLVNNLLTTIRYSIMLYPLLFFLASVGVFEFLKIFSFSKIKGKEFIISLVILLAGLTSLWGSKPFYFEYTNILLPKNYLITGSWGEGGYEAAQYLNSLPDAKNLTVWTDYSGTCEFFVGKCLNLYEVKNLKNSINYYVLTRRGEIRYNPDSIRWPGNPNNVDAYMYYKKENPAWKLEINGRPGDFIKIYQSDATGKN